MSVPFDFQSALEHLKLGSRVRRQGWNGKGMWLCLVNEWEINSFTTETFKWFHPPYRTAAYEFAPFIAMKTADDKIVPWLASQTDLLAKDWEFVPDLKVE